MRHYLIFVAALVITGCGGPAGVPTTPTREADAVPTRTLSPVPTRTSVPTAVVVAELPDLIEARTQLQSGNYERATSLLLRVYAAHPTEIDAQQLLADVYLQSGRALLAQSNADPVQISAAHDQFTSGAAVAPVGAVATDLIREIADADAFLQVLISRSALDQLPDDTLAVQRQQAATTLATQIIALQERRADYPGLLLVATAALVEAGEAYAADTREVEAARTALAYCERARTLAPENTEAIACVKQFTRASVPTVTPAPTRRPVPTVLRQPELFITRIAQTTTPTCLQMQIANIDARNWVLSIDGLPLRGVFDGVNVQVCGLGERQEVTFTIKYPDGSVVPGGKARARGGDIFLGTWR